MTLGLAAGARFRAGGTPDKRHSIGLGFAYQGSMGTYGLHRIGPYLRYGVFLVPTWLSLHTEAQLGVLATRALGSMADLYLGLGGHLCVWNEAFCFRTDYTVGAYFKTHQDSASGWTFALAVDPLRLVDNARARADKR